MTDHEAQDLIMALFGHMALSHLTDRSKPGIAHLDMLTGQPKTVHDQLPEHLGVGGQQLAMETWVIPKRFAAGLCVRQVGNDAVRLATVNPSTLTYEEKDAIYEVTLAIKKAAHQLQVDGFHRDSSKVAGLVDTRPRDLMTGEPFELDEDGMTAAFKITYTGLKRAIDFAKTPEGRRLKWGSLSPEHDFGSEAWRLAPDHVRARWKRPEEEIRIQ